MNIHEEVANAIYWSLAIPRQRVVAEVKGGIVVLRGVVDRAYQRSCAEAVARRVPGVIDVTNNIAVRGEADLPSWQN
jgi:osmotically-inducible protein OsmY